MNAQPAKRKSPDPDRMPLPPRRVASRKCLLERLHRIHALLVRRGFSDAVASFAVEKVLSVGLKALKTGKADSKSPEQRAGWLWRVAIKSARRAAAKEIALVPLGYEPPDIYRSSPEDDAFWEALRNAVDSLPPRQKEAVELHLLQGRSLREAAAEMGIKASTVSSYFKAARVRLRRKLTTLSVCYIPGENAAGR